ncbi:arginine-tRNA-protein transferase [Parasitella parasitica]|nr:arginine-tRNA-protein transferase [Parasitella parasitica]
MTCSDYQDLIDRGWRRSGKYLYKPNLEESCCPQYTIRLDANRFNATKSQKKIINKFNRYIKGTWDPDPNVKPTSEAPFSHKTFNTSLNYVQVKSLKDYIHEPEDINNDNKYKLRIKLEPSSLTKEKFDLYAKYQANVHHDEKEDISETGFKRFLVDSPMRPEKHASSNVEFGSFHQNYILDGKLIALAVIDILPKCVSSVYFIYDPDYSFLGLGKYSVFREISLVQEFSEKVEDLQYYYMGYYIDSCPKMNYKGQYKPSDLLDPMDYTWHSITDFKAEFDQGKSFITFTDPIPSRDYPPGWKDPNSITDDDLEKVFVMIGQAKIAPVTYIVKSESSAKFRKTIMDYVCSVGLELAHKMIIC